MATLQIQQTHAINFSDDQKIAFKEIQIKGGEIDAWASTSRNVISDAILLAMRVVQATLNKAAFEIAESKLKEKTKGGKNVVTSAKKRALLQAVVDAKGANTTRAMFTHSLLMDAIFAAVEWPKNLARSADGTFVQTATRGSKTALVIWENGNEYCMLRDVVRDDNGEPILAGGKEQEVLQPQRAAYLAYDNLKKNPGMMMVEGSLVVARKNPEMFEEDENGKPTSLPKMQNASWREIEEQYRLDHPGKTSGGGSTPDAEAFKTLAENGDVPDTTKIAAVKSILMRHRKNIGAALQETGIEDTRTALRDIAKEINENERQFENAADENKDKADQEEREDKTKAAREAALALKKAS